MHFTNSEAFVSSHSQCVWECVCVCVWVGVCPVCAVQWHSSSWLIRIVSLSKCAVTWAPHTQSPAPPSTLSAAPEETPDSPASLQGCLCLCCWGVKVREKKEQGKRGRREERERESTLISYLPGGPSRSASGASASQVSTSHSWAMVMGPGWTLQEP